jgi:5-methylcytosine-specific restriction endonuclease McrA
MINQTKKELLCRFVNNKCEQCKIELETHLLHIHRINRGYNGGNYEDFRNLKVLCSKCHKLYHSKEFK